MLGVRTDCAGQLLEQEPRGLPQPQDPEWMWED